MKIVYVKDVIIKKIQRDQVIYGFKCIDKYNNEILLDNNNNCQSCNKEFDSKKLNEIAEDAKLLYHNALQISASGDHHTAAEMLEKKLLKGTPANFLHSKHSIMFNATLAAMNIFRHIGKYKKTIEYAQKALEILRSFKFDNYPETADVLFELGEGLLFYAASIGQTNNNDDKNIVESLPHEKLTEIQLDDKEKSLLLAKDAYKESYLIRKTCFGEKNILTTSVLKRLRSLQTKEEIQAEKDALIQQNMIEDGSELINVKLPTNNNNNNNNKRNNNKNKKKKKRKKSIKWKKIK